MKLHISLFAFFANFSLATATPKKPNIVFIFADDMAYETIGAYGELDIDTPNLDKLVKQGTSFNRAYNMGAYGPAVCVASRTMLITGRSLWDAENTNLQKQVEKKESWPLQIKQAGYDTYLTGKWHVKTAPALHFDVVKNVRAGMPKSTKDVYNRPKSPEDYEKGWKPWDKDKKGFWQGGTHWSVITADDAVGFIETASKKETPFFIYAAFNAPHDPRQAPKSFIDQYPLDRIKVPASFLPEHPHHNELCGKGLRDEKLMPFPRTEYNVKVNRQEYFALVSHMDEQIGRILDAVEASGKADNTYIVFTADHGLAVGKHGLAGKQSLYEHSTRSPFIIAGPGIKAGASVETPIYLQDVASTTIELTGNKAPESYYFKSLLPLMERADQDIHHGDIFGSYLNHLVSITSNDWKLISLKTVNSYELYDLKNDPHELKNLANDPAHTDRKLELIKLLTAKEKKLRGSWPIKPPKSSKKKKKK